PRNDRTPFRVTLSDEDGHTILLVYWNELASKFRESQQFKLGDLLRLKGQISDYRGKLQIRLLNPTELWVVESAAVEEHDIVTDFTILDAAPDGKSITLRGIILDSSTPTDDGVFSSLLLEDAYGEQLRVTSQQTEVSDLIDRLTLTPGKSVQLDAKVVRRGNQVGVPLLDPSTLSILS